jgi:hypothetical protein
MAKQPLLYQEALIYPGKAAIRHRGTQGKGLSHFIPVSGTYVKSEGTASRFLRLNSMD